MNRVVLTLGSFDLLHVGHLELLQASRDLAGEGRVVVGLNTDRFITDYKGRAPIQPYAHREAMLRACRYVDLVVPNIGGPDSKPCIEMIRPDLLTIGDDWFERDYLAQLGVTQAWLDQRRLKIAYIPRTTGESTTRLRSLIA